MREDIDFESGGLRLKGWYFRADRAAPGPAIVMSHGFSAVKEFGLAAFAERFCADGFDVLVFDYRHLGASDGALRGRIVAQEQHDDLRAALSFAADQPSVDPARIGVWGTSYSGGHALFVGMVDPRVKAVVAQAPAISVARSLMALAGEDGFAVYLAMLADDHGRRNRGEPGGAIPIVAPAGQPSILPTEESYRWFMQAAAHQGSTWCNETSLESVARMMEYDSSMFLGVCPAKPVLLVAATEDSLIPVEQVRDAYARAAEPKRLLEYPCGHFGFYPGESHHEQAAGAAAAWFAEHL